MVRPEAAQLPHRIHLVGVGGTGLSAIARVLATWGHEVSGSDLNDSPIMRELQKVGITTYIGHSAVQVNGAELVVMSSAIPESNPEVQAARAAGIPVIKRQQLLGNMMAGSFGIAVAGTHGKTTTTAMISVVLERLGLSPTFIVGGVVADLGTNAQAGGGKHFVIEADEYDRAFHGLQPQVAVVTNIEMDHPDCYQDIADMRAAFDTFLQRVPKDGHIVACADSVELMRVIAGRMAGGPHILTYGASPAAQFVVGSFAPNGQGGIDCLVARGGRTGCSLSLAVPGVHNALNGAAAIIVAHLLGLERAEVARVLSGYHGTLRRFEVKGQRGGITVVDDYAHHPTQVRATLASARMRYPGRRIWAVFQPHTYSRTRALLAELSACFGDADEVIITDVYPARSREVATVSGAELTRAVRHPCVQHIGSLDAVEVHLLAHLRAGDVLLTLGAGDGYLVGERVLERLARCEG